ncbi:hypothetical protein RF55_20731 [Lasius niger]|uniref:CCHC-type domain-containing protein n=1 Tax=Lasius niger TaxID=67767 RepID=A0A0J7JZ67_LASNI|nr:hypothetical protein RF55_20731 [Lasius niger]
MSKDCQFKDVTAEQNKNEYIRDAFISGLLCSRIRQRLLKNITLTMDAAFDQARALEMAEQHSASYSGPLTTTAAAEIEPDPVTPEATVAGISKTERCYFCGESRHSRMSCPARNAICTLCNKKGHYQRRCDIKVPYLGRITMANSSLSTEITGRCKVKLEMKSHTYSEV